MMDDDDKLLDVVGPDTPHPGHQQREREHSRERDERTSERGEGSESSGSESGGPAHVSASEGPRPDVSVGPPMHPPLLPYIYPPVPGMFASPSHLMPPNPLALHAGGVTPGMLINAQLALAASQHQFFSHYPLPPHLHGLKNHRFSPYPLPTASHGSAFETVTPGSRNLSPRSPPPRPPTNSPTSSAGGIASSTGELKSIENMVNGLQDKRSQRSPSLTPGHRDVDSGGGDRSP